MNKLTVLATVAVLPLSASPAFAQAAINEPGLYSFYHPDGDLLGVGARQIRPGIAPSASPANALAAPAPRASRRHGRTARPAN
jgi:hypothetical protein